MTIDSHVAETTGDHSDAIFAESNTSGVNVTSYAAITTGDYSKGVVARTNDGAVTLNSTYVETSGRAAAGLYATNSGAGGIDVESGAVITHGVYADGIFAFGGSNVYVGSGFVATYGYESTGIVAESFGGAVTAVSGDMITHGGSVGRHLRRVLLRNDFGHQ